ncbi:hypothetical protein AAE478_006796 [Parahypoxylon ruwenzoriense]
MALTDDATFDWVQYKVADFTPEEGGAFPYVLLSVIQSTPITCQQQYLGRNSDSSSSTKHPKPRVWVQGGVHGNEPAGDLCARSRNGPGRGSTCCCCCRATTRTALPTYFQCALARNLNPNRERTKLAHRMSRGHERLLSAFVPHVTVDVYEFIRNKALVFVALEPENVDSYVRFNLVLVREDDEYPSFRIPR